MQADISQVLDSSLRKVVRSVVYEFIEEESLVARFVSIRLG